MEYTLPHSEYVIEEKRQSIDFSFRKSRSFQGDMHIHLKEYELYLFVEGNAQLCINGVIYHLMPGDLFIISPNTPHRVEAVAPHLYSRIVLHMTREMIEHIAQGQVYFLTAFEEHINKCFRLTEDEKADFMRLFDALAAEIRSTPPPHEENLLAIYAYYTIILTKVLRIASSVSPLIAELPELFQKINDYIDKNLDSITLSVQEIADAMNISRSHLSHVYSKYSNDSLWNTILNKRLVLAKKLLIKGCTISEASLQSGFSNYAHFIKSFKKAYGISPKRYVLQYYEENSSRAIFQTKAGRGLKK